MNLDPAPGSNISATLKSGKSAQDASYGSARRSDTNGNVRMRPAVTPGLRHPLNCPAQSAPKFR
jgi:hypothetical protein